MGLIFVTGATGFVGHRLLGALTHEVDGDSSNVRLRVLTSILHPDYESVVCDLQSDNVPDDALNGVAVFSILQVMRMICMQKIN
jgi:nucleoside-diphosphate-sugar epimerase